MAVNQSKEAGPSVYCQTPLEERMNQPLYAAARELVQRHSKTNHVLDLGCTDLVASLGLEQAGFVVYGLDLDGSSLTSARKHTSTARLVQADVTQLPLGRADKIDTVLLLDILEHLEWEEARSLLIKLQEKIRKPFTAIVSMPIISPTSLRCLFEVGQMLITRKRPTTGLFDRTHVILTGKKGHQRLFQQAGYVVAERYSSDWPMSISGEWKTVAPANPTKSFKHQAYWALTRCFVPAIVHPLCRTKRPRVTDALTACQGVYVLKPQTFSALDQR